MKILVINADCIQVNTSANLCHLAYIRGLTESGHEVDLLSSDGRDYNIDQTMKIPESVRSFTYYGVSLYEKVSIRKKSSQHSSNKCITQLSGSSIPERVRKKSILGKIALNAKHFVFSLYGPHGIYATFARKASRFHSNVEYDFVISLSTPPASHLLANTLIRRHRIKAKHWIQIWEDPWYTDAYGFSEKSAVFKEERRLLACAESICYVSPLTLKNQKKLFPESADKMFWQPLPYYYKTENTDLLPSGRNIYGYFGAYYPTARNLEPFYQAAVQQDISVRICGDPSYLFSPTNSIIIYPRLSLQDLKPIEDESNILVFLCNRKGGQIPGKIYQYSVTQKTILFILDGTPEEKSELKEYFGKFNRYVFCENTVEDISRAIRAIEKNELGSVRNEPLEEFNPQKTIQNILMGCER